VFSRNRSQPQARTQTRHAVHGLHDIEATLGGHQTIPKESLIRGYFHSLNNRSDGEQAAKAAVEEFDRVWKTVGENTAQK
jgi:hypothetical protein